MSVKFRYDNEEGAIRKIISLLNNRTNFSIYIGSDSLKPIRIVVGGFDSGDNYELLIVFIDSRTFAIINDNKPVITTSISEIVEWLYRLGYEELAQFFEDHEDELNEVDNL